jgi:hypothetical protein
MKPDGGPAFPLPVAEIQGIATHSGQFGPEMTGMTVRDWFAAKAMAALIMTEGYASDEDGDFVARCAYEFADAMLAEREK